MEPQPPAIVRATAIDLQDLVPSARALTGCIRSVLWGIVEECGWRACSDESARAPVREQNDHDADEDAAGFLAARKRLLADMVEHGCGVLAEDADTHLPMQFGKSRASKAASAKPKQPLKQAKLRRESRMAAVTGAVLRCPLPVPDDEATIAEHNLFLARFPPDASVTDDVEGDDPAEAEWYPVRVVGNAPYPPGDGDAGSSYGGDGGGWVTIEYLGYDDGYHCLPRAALRPVPAPPAASSSSLAAAYGSRFASKQRRAILPLLDRTMFPPAPAHLPPDVVKVFK